MEGFFNVIIIFIYRKCYIYVIIILFFFIFVMVGVIFKLIMMDYKNFFMKGVINDNSLFVNYWEKFWFEEGNCFW